MSAGHCWLPRTWRQGVSRAMLLLTIQPGGRGKEHSAAKIQSWVSVVLPHAQNLRHPYHNHAVRSDGKGRS